jgi:hypothetical protein
VIGSCIEMPKSKPEFFTKPCFLMGAGSRTVAHVRPCLLACFTTGWLVSTGWAQAATQPQPQDPLITLLMSQPKIELSAPVRVSATFDPPAVKLGGTSVYRVTFSALEDSVDWPEDLAMPAGLEAHPGGRGQILQMAGPTMEPRSGFNYHVRANEPGTFTIPAFKVVVYGRPVEVPAARLEVTDTKSSNTNETQQLIVQADRTNVFVGQAVKVRVSMPSPWGGVQILSQVQFKGQGILADQSTARQSIEPEPGGRPNRIQYVYETMLTPITSGTISFHAQGWCAPNRAPAPTVVNGVLVSAGLEYVLLDSEPFGLQVSPLPTEGQLPGFTGAVGKFSSDPPTLSTNAMRVGEPARLLVTVKGDGNIARLVPPPPPEVPDWRIFAAQLDRSAPQMLHAQGSVSFTYSLVPLSDRAKATPAIPFSYFEPDSRRYVDASIPSLPVSVSPGKSPEALKALLAAQALMPVKQRELVLHGISRAPGYATASLTPLQQRPWFLVVQMIPALGFLLLWSWDRRRRFLEQHPGVLLRRRARKALHRHRREICRATKAKDGDSLVQAAVRGMQAACAPHYPAEANALVGSDVLAVLDPTERSGPEGKLVRRIFETHDTALFTETPTDASRLLETEGELARVLNNLEEKLHD